MPLFDENKAKSIQNINERYRFWNRVHKNDSASNSFSRKHRIHLMITLNGRRSEMQQFQCTFHVCIASQISVCIDTCRWDGWIYLSLLWKFECPPRTSPWPQVKNCCVSIRHLHVIQIYQTQYICPISALTFAWLYLLNYFSTLRNNIIGTCTWTHKY